MPTNLEDLIHVDGDDNTAGVATHIYIARLEDIKTLPLPKEDNSASTTGTLADLVTIVDDIVMKEGKSFRRFDVTLETGELKDEAQGEIDGMSFVNQLDFFISGSSAIALGFRQWVKNSNVIILVQELDGKVRQLGHRAYPAKMVPAAGTTGKAAADRKGSNFSFKSVRKGPAPIFTGKVVDEDGTVQPLLFSV